MRKILKIAVAVMLLIILTSTSVYAIDVYIENQKVAYTNNSGYPFISNNRTLVPLRATMEAYGATVEWDSSTQTAVVKKGTTTVRCKIGSKNITRNNVIIPNDAPAVVKNGRTYLPIRVVLESFGAKVSWNGNVVVTGNSTLIRDIETKPSITTNYWGTWNTAIAEKNKGNYQAAINKIRTISNVFLKTNKNDSKAMLFKHLGECYANLKQYNNASECFNREAYYWNLANMRETCIDAERRAKLIATNTQIYVQSTDLTDGAFTYFKAPNEPVGKTLLGAYAETDSAIYNPNDPKKFYMDTFPKLVGRDISAYLLYLPYGKDISFYASHVKKAKEKNKVIEIALEPHQGLKTVSDANGYITKLARNMKATGCKFLLRFASEINDPTCKWYTTDTKLYIEKFRLVSSIFKKEAPNVAIVWSINHYPEDTIPKYYPGDKYVDYVGVSSYKSHSPVTDPFKKGVDRGRWSNQLDTIYSLYAHKKPIIIVEGAASCIDKDTNKNVTDFASKQLYDFYTYLPLKYPNVKYCFIFDSDKSNKEKFSLSANSTYLNAYKKGISSPLYGLNINDPHKYHYYEIGNNVRVKAGPNVLASYITTPDNNVSYVNYYINDVFLGTAYAIPYNCKVSFTSFKNKKVKVTAKAFDSKNKLISNYSTTISVY